MSMFPLQWLGRHGAKIAVIVVLGIPAAVAFNNSVGPNDENRHLAQLPPVPHSWKALFEMPSQINAWINDHFGYRREFVRFNNRLRFAVFHEFPSIQMTSGQHGRYFLAAHGTNVPPYQALTNVCGALSSARESTVPYLNHMFAGFHSKGMHPKLLIVPSSPVVHSEDVPAWLVASCSSSETPVTAMLKSPALTAEARSEILFPLQEMREIRKTAELFPKTWFHWSGKGLDQVARLSLTHFWGRPLDQAPAFQTQTQMANSDVSHLFDGIELKSELTTPDLAAANVKACQGSDCFPEIADIAKTLGDVTRIANPGAPARRLLIISDSYGAKIAPWYSRYYGTIEHFATNNVEQLSPEQIARFKAFAYRQPADTDILFLYHDGGAIYDTLRLGTERLLP